MNRPQIKVRPADDMGDPEVAKIYDGLFRHIQVQSEADLAYDTACDLQVACGEGFFRILTEYCDERSFDQDIAIAPIADRFKVSMDPIGLLQHPAGRKCQWGFIVEDLPKEEYEAQYGDGEFAIDWEDSSIGELGDWFPNKDTVRIAEYFEIEKKDAKLFEWANSSVSVGGEKLPEGVTAVEKPKRERTTQIPRCIWRKLNGQHVLAEREMPTKYIPIVRVVGNQWIVEGKPIVSGLVRNAKDAQRMYNYNASMEVELNSLAPRAPITALVEQIKGHEDKYRSSNRVNYAVLPYNGIYDQEGNIISVAPPARMTPAMPQAAIITAKMAAADDIKSTTGQYDPSLGNNPQAKSGIALQREQVKSEVGTFHYVDNLARALRYAGTIMLDMAPKVYTGKRVLRILGEDGEPDHVLIDPTIQGAVQEVKDEQGLKVIGKAFRLDVGKYDLVVTTGPSFTTKRQEASEFLTNAIQAAKDPAMATVLTYLALKSNDWAGAEEATEMVKKLLPPGLVPADGEEGQAEIPPEVKQMIDELKHGMGQMKGQLDTATQALAERDATLKDLQGQLKGRNVEAMAKMYEADKRAMAEIEKARAEVLIARVDAVTAAMQQPQNADLAAVVTKLDQVLGQMQEKIEGLTASAAAIAEELQNFEIAARMPAQQGVAA
jgi:hypothetical protein